MNLSISLSSFGNSSLIEERTMFNGNNMPVRSNVFIEILTVSKTIAVIHNLLFTERSNETLAHSFVLNSILEVLDKTLTSHKNNLHCTIIGIFVKNVTDSSFQLRQRQELTVSIKVTFTANLKHTSSTINRFTVIAVFKFNSTVRKSVIGRQPQPFFVHYSHVQAELAHFLANPKIGSTATFSLLKLIFSNNIRNITSNFFRKTEELKLRSHFTWPHSITTITFRIRF